MAGVTAAALSVAWRWAEEWGDRRQGQSPSYSLTTRCSTSPHHPPKYCTVAGVAEQPPLPRSGQLQPLLGLPPWPALRGGGGLLLCWGPGGLLCSHRRLQGGSPL